MNTTRSLILGASIVLGCLIISLQPGAAVNGASAVSPPGVGNYQVVVSQPNAGELSTVFVFDPATGRTWFRSTNSAIKVWTDLGSPAIK